MADKHSFTPVNIMPPVPNVAAGGAAPPYTVKTLPNNADVANIENYTFVEYIYDDAAEVAWTANPTDADLNERAAAARRINFFKFGPGGVSPTYIAKNDDPYSEDNTDVNIGDTIVAGVIANKKYLIIRKDGDGMLGGSKSVRKGRKSARKGRKSARKSRRSKGSQSKK